jgi:uncharacterized protein YecE (DUF72 family)
LKKDLNVLEKFLENFNYPNKRPNQLPESSDRINSNRITRPNNNIYQNKRQNNIPEYQGFGPNSGSLFGQDSGNLKLAIEFRHKSWLDKETYDFLKKKKVAFVISDSPRWPTDIVKTTDFVYIRFHGKPHLFASKYEKEELQRYAKEIKKLKPKILFAYFNNDAEGYAVEDALEFQKLF